MAKCYKCGIAEADVGLLCHDCVEAGRAELNVRREPYLIQAREKEVSKRSFSLQGLLPVVFILGALFFLARSFGLFGYGQLPPLKDLTGNSAGFDSCTGKRLCLVVVLAPWCPACKHSIPFVQAVERFVTRKPALGIQVVVGMDKPAALMKMADALGPKTAIDPNGAVHHALGGGGVPRWGLIDHERRIISRGSGLPGGLRESHPAFEAYLRDNLGME